MWEQHFVKLLVPNQQEWREKEYWIEENDLIYKNYAMILENVYKTFSVKRVRPGQKSFMSLEEFIDIFKQLHLLGDHLN